jgi:SOS regulatory protein LexA
MTFISLTKKQRAVYETINHYVRSYERPPTVRELASELRLAPATVQEHINALREKGYIERGDLAPMNLFTAAIQLPLSGLITAGAPIEAIEEREAMAVPASLVVDGANSYVLKVKGQSMIEDGILDGDFVIVERNPSPRNGDVVVALLDNAFATLKRFYREPNRIRLQPANASMDPIYVRDVSIQGIVRAVIRQFARV